MVSANCSFYIKRPPIYMYEVWLIMYVGYYIFNKYFEYYRWYETPLSYSNCSFEWVTLWAIYLNGVCWIAVNSFYHIYNVVIYGIYTFVNMIAIFCSWQDQRLFWNHWNCDTSIFSLEVLLFCSWEFVQSRFRLSKSLL